MKLLYRIVVIKGRKWWWRIESFNSEILAHSESYNSKSAAVKTAKRLQAKLSNSELVIN